MDSQLQMASDYDWVTTTSYAVEAIDASAAGEPMGPEVAVDMTAEQRAELYSGTVLDGWYYYTKYFAHAYNVCGGMVAIVTEQGPGNWRMYAHGMPLFASSKPEDLESCKKTIDEYLQSVISEYPMLLHTGCNPPFGSCRFSTQPEE